LRAVYEIFIVERRKKRQDKKVVESVSLGVQGERGFRRCGRRRRGAENLQSAAPKEFLDAPPQGSMPNFVRKEGKRERLGGVCCGRWRWGMIGGEFWKRTGFQGEAEKKIFQRACLRTRSP
jgi:hypothetical protein